MAVSGVTALTALGWALSYAALRQLALSAGMPTWAATLWPLCVDLFVFVATVAAISAGAVASPRRTHGRSPCKEEGVAGLDDPVGVFVL